MSDSALVMGVDVGGTSTRVLVADLDGETRGRGRAAGGNPTAWPVDQAAAALGSAVSGALQGIDPSAVQAVVLGIAGGGALDDPRTADHFDRLWSEIGLRCVPQVVGDLAIAFASATPEPDGTVVVSGTGAAAAMIKDHLIVRSADGHGWLLGDAGSGFWIGRESVRRTLTRLDEGLLEPTELSERVLSTVLGAERPDTAQQVLRALIRTLNSRPPVKLSELARVVEESADRGDPEAVEIVEQAASALIHTLGRVREPAEDSPLVLVGGILRPESAVARSLRTHLADGFAGPVLAASDGVAGAAWLAARSVTKDEERELASHARLTAAH